MPFGFRCHVTWRCKPITRTENLVVKTRWQAQYGWPGSRNIPFTQYGRSHLICALPHTVKCKSSHALAYGSIPCFTAVVEVTCGGNHIAGASWRLEISSCNCPASRPINASPHNIRLDPAYMGVSLLSSNPWRGWFWCGMWRRLWPLAETHPSSGYVDFWVV